MAGARPVHQPARDDLVACIALRFPPFRCIQLAANIAPAALDEAPDVGASGAAPLAEPELEASDRFADGAGRATETGGLTDVPTSMADVAGLGAPPRSAAWTDEIADLLEPVPPTANVEASAPAVAASEPRIEPDHEVEPGPGPGPETAADPQVQPEQRRQSEAASAPAAPVPRTTALQPADIAPDLPNMPPRQRDPFAYRPAEPSLPLAGGNSAAHLPAHHTGVFSGHDVPAADPGAVADVGHATGRTAAARRDWRSYLRTGARILGIVLAAWFTIVVAAIILFRFVDPPGSMLMLSQRIGGTAIEQRWVDLDHISRNVVTAVVVSEDGRFCRHWGIDPAEIVAAIERARGGVPRGASTITMQVAKNLFLWPSKSYLRKALEVPVTLAIELIWSKSRILEVYLNIAEWGPGVFGIEAAARHHFKKSAARLGQREAALLAVALPNPISRVAGRAGPVTRRLARIIEARARRARAAASCIAGAK